MELDKSLRDAEERGTALSARSPEYMDQITIPLNDVAAFTPRKKLRVVTIGAGFSGLILAHKIQHEHVKEMSEIIDHVIYEAMDQIGGTWVANTYPGVQCDVPSAIYVRPLRKPSFRPANTVQAFPFEPNPDWSQFYSSGPEILEYMKKTVKKWNLDRDIQFSTTVKEACWQEESSQWKLTLEHKGEEREEYADILVSARGFLSTWTWPSIPGIHDFKGHRVHSASWDDSYDYSNKRIGIIGNGSSGIQILPQMAQLPGTEVTSFQRGPTWIVSRLRPAKLVGSEDPATNPLYTDADRERFRNPEEIKKYRKMVQGNVNSSFKMVSRHLDDRSASSITLTPKLSL